MSKRPKVVVVDDSPIVLRAVESALLHHGWDVVPLDDVNAGAARILDENADIVLLDVHMPSLSGESLTRLLLSRNRNGATKVILHSSNTAANLRQLVRETGAHGFVQKSADAAGLHSKLQSFLSTEPDARD